jgi:hypothetical protein
MQLLEDVCFRKPRKLAVRSKPKTDKDGGGGGGGDVSSSSHSPPPCASQAEEEDDDDDDAACAEHERNYLRAQMQKSLANFRDICYCASLRSASVSSGGGGGGAADSNQKSVGTGTPPRAAESDVLKPVLPAFLPAGSFAEPSVDASLLACISHALTFVGNASHFFKVDLDAYQPVQSSPVVVRRDEVCAEYLKEVQPEASSSAEEAKETTKRKPKKRSVAKDCGAEHNSNPRDSTTAPCATASPIKHDDEVPRVFHFSEEDTDMSKESSAGSAGKHTKSAKGLVEDAKREPVECRDVAMGAEMEDTTTTTPGVGVAVSREEELPESRRRRPCLDTVPRKKNSSNITGYFSRVNSPKRRKLSETGEHRPPPESTTGASSSSSSSAVSSSSRRGSMGSGKVKQESEEQASCDFNTTTPPKRGKVSSSHHHHHHQQHHHQHPHTKHEAAKKDCQEPPPPSCDAADREEAVRRKGFLVEQAAPLAGDDQDEVVYKVTKQYHPSFLVWRLLGWWDPNCEGNEPLSLLPSVIQPDPLALFQVAGAHQKAVFERLSSVMKPEPGALRKEGFRNQNQNGFAFLSGRRKDTTTTTTTTTTSVSSSSSSSSYALIGHVLGHGGSLDSLYPQCLGMHRDKSSSSSSTSTSTSTSTGGGGARLSFLSSTLGGPELDDALAFFAKLESSGVDFLDDDKDREYSRRANHEVRNVTGTFVT